MGFIGFCVILVAFIKLNKQQSVALKWSIISKMHLSSINQAKCVILKRQHHFFWPVDKRPCDHFTNAKNNEIMRKRKWNKRMQSTCNVWKITFWMVQKKRKKHKQQTKTTQSMPKNLQRCEHCVYAPNCWHRSRRSKNAICAPKPKWNRNALKCSENWRSSLIFSPMCLCICGES